MSRIRVAVTATGAVCAAAKNSAELCAALVLGRRVFAPNRRLELDFEVTVGQVPDDWFATHNHADLDSLTGSLCLTAARECATSARRGGAPKPDGLVLGTSTGGQSENERVVFALLDGRDPGDFSYRGQGCMASPARLVARDLNIEGPVQTISTACTSSANAIAVGAEWIRSGRRRAVLAGGGDALCKTTLTSFRALELTGPAMCTPFGPDRPGLTLGEGSGFLMLESMDQAIADGRRVLAELLGGGMGSDAHHMTAPPEDGSGAETAMKRALADANLSPDQVHHINAHGTGTMLNDAAEAAAVGRLFGDRVKVMSCKGLSGHTLGGAGGLEAVASVLSIIESLAFENVGASIPDPDLDVHLVGAGGFALPDHTIVLSNSFAFGGNNCSLLFGSAGRTVS